jgi:uncharacterized integral membrane protein
MVTYIKVLVLIAILFVAITFGTQNSESVTLRYYFGLASSPVPFYLVIYVAIILGIIAGMAIGMYSRVTLKRGVKKLEKGNVSLRGEIEKMKGEIGEEVQEKEEIGLTESQSVAKQLSNSSIGDG